MAEDKETKKVVNDAKNEKVTAAKKEKPAKKAKKEAVKKEKPAKKEVVRKVVVDPNFDPFDTLQFVLMTEKCVRMIESQNKLVFVVRRTADKKLVKKAIENAFQVPVKSVTTAIDQKGRKRAYVCFAQTNAAGDIAVRLGII